MRSVIVIAHNIRSCHNVGSIFRTCEGFGVEQIILSGYTPYPQLVNDVRLPHIAQKITAQIHKTALGAETLVPFSQTNQVDWQALRDAGYRIVALEQSPTSILLPNYAPPDKIALLLGEEVDGVAANLLAECDDALEIPMFGRKESFNVSIAAGIALYHLRMM
ncbi:MAG: TrmH family RNA methyltransferase [Candidatus Saccharimonadales bacterium]